eukprot:TRINITY_DN14527_c0_g1_i1.p1 TRINITY_DN14527_c0_g1~~TRINITY_DN14527_c0_g1_i1.p1  ORF type:complete len:688 (-),score=117.72 TRINITY_DN14527_c0_g1_i1:10-2019(-)
MARSFHYRLIVLAVLLLERTGEAEVVLENAAAVAKHGYKIWKAGDKKLGRGFISLALHMNPYFFRDANVKWLEKVVGNEPLEYWTGNVFLGLDKTRIEDVVGRGQEQWQNVNMGVFAWRNLQLTGESCCGIDNLAVYMQANSLHLYLAQFVDLANYGTRLKDHNHPMYNSFVDWWKSIGSPAMPHPQITYRDGHFDWASMRVAMRPSRVPDGWNELVNAVLLYHVDVYDGAVACVRTALQRNPELSSHVKLLMPRLPAVDPTGPLVPTSSAAAAASAKYVICYNPAVGLGNLAVVMVSARLLAKLTGRVFLLDWNVNKVVQHAFKLRETPEVGLLQNKIDEVGVTPANVRQLYFFHMMHSPDLGSILELFGCSDMKTELQEQVVTVSSNLFFAPLLAGNPHTPPEVRTDFPSMLEDLLEPSEEAAAKARNFAKEVGWGTSVPVVALHIRAREEGEDNDDWPTKASPTKQMLEKLRSCLERAVADQLGSGKAGWFSSSPPQWDLLVASTTKKARSAAAIAMAGSKGLRQVLELPAQVESRKSKQGSIDAMAEALLISRANAFVRLVIGTEGFSTFAYLSNALRQQNGWVKDMPELHRSGYAPNYVVTNGCGAGRCFVAQPEVRMARIGWHGKRFTQRSCGDPVERLELPGPGGTKPDCRSLKAIDIDGEL